jgi:SPP1 family predicted phage head-tail adaptor
MEEDMSLLDSAMEDFVIIDKVTAPDGYGGVITTWKEGATIKAACVLNSSAEAQIAHAMTSTGLYTITTRKNANLQYHDVLKRKRDNKIFRVTSDGDDLATPASASLNMRNVSAEEWSLPDGQSTSNL